MGIRRSGDHVARVLLMAGRVGQDELSAGRAEITVSDVDGDSLLPLGAQAIGQQRKIGLACAAVQRGARDGVHLVLIHIARIEQQAPDEGRLAIVDASGSGKTQKVFAVFLFDEAVDVKRCSNGSHQK